jgi:hypothetical protein
MSTYNFENRVRLDPTVFSLLEEASKLTGKSMRDLASESVRKYLEENILPGRGPRKLARPPETAAFWDKQIEQVESQLNDLRLHKRMMEMMNPPASRSMANRKKAQ